MSWMNAVIFNMAANKHILKRTINERIIMTSRSTKIYGVGPILKNNFL